MPGSGNYFSATRVMEFAPEDASYPRQPPLLEPKMNLCLCVLQTVSYRRMVLISPFARSNLCDTNSPSCCMCPECPERGTFKGKKVICVKHGEMFACFKAECQQQIVKWMPDGEVVFPWTVGRTAVLAPSIRWIDSSGLGNFWGFLGWIMGRMRGWDATMVTKFLEFHTLTVDS